MNYQAEYNYYIAMNEWKPQFEDWLTWRNTNAVAQMNASDN